MKPTCWNLLHIDPRSLGGVEWWLLRSRWLPPQGFENSIARRQCGRCRRGDCRGCLNVTEPTSTGLGGDAFALFYQAAERRVYALNGSGRAPAALTLERLQREGLGEELPPVPPLYGNRARRLRCLVRYGGAFWPAADGEVLAPARGWPKKAFRLRR
jgi:hypothetical protein